MSLQVSLGLKNHKNNLISTAHKLCLDNKGKDAGSEWRSGGCA
jgi:hypothetical protein